jgi:thiamine-phosphate pyrophosphorylase
MAESCLLYYITDRSAFRGDERVRRQQLLHKIAEAAANGIDFIQLREKDLAARDLETLARDAMSVIRKSCTPRAGPRQASTALLINSRVDVALAVAAAGVHLRSHDVSPQEVRIAWRCCADAALCGLLPNPPLIAVSCHSPKDIKHATRNGATFAVFAPVFEKKDEHHVITAGLEALRRACSASIPVLALGGITMENAASCLDAGAAGIAAIRLFQENEISKIVRALRG